MTTTPGRWRVAAGLPVVVKAGSSSLVEGSGELDPEGLELAVSHVADMWREGHPTLLVSSGAVAAGFPALGLSARPRDVPGQQAAAAVGQGLLMERYAALFKGQGMVVGQVLLTKDVLANRAQYLNARNTLERMLSLGVVPIVNENDTVVVDEVRVGDNDSLAAIVSHLVGAGMMILLTDTPGIYSGDPWISETAELLTAVRHTDEVLDRLRSTTTRGDFGSGGVATKIAAARMAAWSGVPTVIASASEPDVVTRALTGADVGTWVDPRASGLSARKLWIAFGSPPEGHVSVDAGAVRAIAGAGKSLLAVGVTDVTGSFGAGAAVEVVHEGSLVAKGLVAMSAGEIGAVRGQHSSVAGGEVIHRDDLVVLT